MFGYFELGISTEVRSLVPRPSGTRERGYEVCSLVPKQAEPIPCSSSNVAIACQRAALTVLARASLGERMKMSGTGEGLPGCVWMKLITMSVNTLTMLF